MKGGRITVDNGICPFCGLHESSEGNKVVVLNTLTGDRLVSCECDEDYFITEVEDDI